MQQVQQLTLTKEEAKVPTNRFLRNNPMRKLTYIVSMLFSNNNPRLQTDVDFRDQMYFLTAQVVLPTWVPVCGLFHTNRLKPPYYFFRFSFHEGVIHDSYHNAQTLLSILEKENAQKPYQNFFKFPHMILGSEYRGTSYVYKSVAQDKLQLSEQIEQLHTYMQNVTNYFFLRRQNSFTQKRSYFPKIENEEKDKHTTAGNSKQTAQKETSNAHMLKTNV